MAQLSNAQITIDIDPGQSFGANRKAINDEFERRYVSHMLKRHGGNISRAAREANMDRKHLHDMCKKHGISRDSLGIE